MVRMKNSVYVCIELVKRDGGGDGVERRRRKTRAFDHLFFHNRSSLSAHDLISFLIIFFYPLVIALL